jgi:ABC-type phosphate transport system auxiliary subunit
MKSAISFTAIFGLLICMASATVTNAVGQDAELLEFTSRYLKTLMESNQTRMAVAGERYQQAANDNDPDEAGKQTEIISRLNAATRYQLQSLSSGRELKYPLDFLIQDIELALQRRSEAGVTIAKCFRERDNGKTFVNAVNLRSDADKWIGITGGALATAEKILKDGGDFGNDNLENPTINDDSRFLNQFISLYFDGSKEFEKSPLQLRISQLNKRRDGYTQNLRRMGSALSTAQDVLELEEARLERIKFSFDGKLSAVVKNVCFRLSEVQIQLVESHRSMVQSIEIPINAQGIVKAQEQLTKAQNEAEQLKLSLAILNGTLQRGGKLSE